MVRTILSVVLGYLAIMVCVFVALTAAYLGIGPERAFRPGVYDQTLLWIAIWAVISLVSAIVGGWTCARIARSRRTAGVLMGVVLAFGALQVIGTVAKPAPTGEDAVRPTPTAFSDAMSKARAPVWVAIVTPVLGAAGVWVGSGLNRRSGAHTPSPLK